MSVVPYSLGQCGLLEQWGIKCYPDSSCESVIMKEDAERPPLQIYPAGEPTVMEEISEPPSQRDGSCQDETKISKDYVTLGTNFSFSK